MDKVKSVSSPKIKVLVVDDHPILRQGIVRLIEVEPDMVVTGQAGGVPEALRAVEQVQPDVAIVDLSLKEESGIDLIKELTTRWPDLAILVFSMHNELFYAERALRAGAKGYVTKGEPCDLVIEGIRQVAKGEIYIGEKLACKMVESQVGVRRDRDRGSIDRLSDREFQVFEMIGRGLHTRQIAEKLNLSVKTIDAHRENIKGKLKLLNGTDLLKTAIQWIQLEHRT